MATPHVVGLVSLMKTLQPNIQRSEIKTLLRSESVSVNTSSSKLIASYAVPEKVINQMINPQVAVVEETSEEVVVEEEDKPQEEAVESTVEEDNNDTPVIQPVIVDSLP